MRQKVAFTPRLTVTVWEVLVVPEPEGPLTLPILVILNSAVFPLLKALL